MSDIYPPLSLKKTAWKALLRKTEDFLPGNHIVFQGAKNYISSDLQNIAEQLFRISNDTKASILLLPIGRATGHEDHIPLEKLFNILKNKRTPCAIQDSTNVLDIMASIAFSKSYIGTSLHGAITSYSFGHKVCGIAIRKVKKLGNFVSTWMTPGDYHLSEETDFADAFLGLTKLSYSISDHEKLKNQKTAIYQEVSTYRQA